MNDQSKTPLNTLEQRQKKLNILIQKANKKFDENIHKLENILTSEKGFKQIDKKQRSIQRQYQSARKHTVYLIKDQKKLEFQKIPQEIIMPHTTQNKKCVNQKFQFYEKKVKQSENDLIQQKMKFVSDHLSKITDQHKPLSPLEGEGVDFQEAKNNTKKQKSISLKNLNLITNFSKIPNTNGFIIKTTKSQRTLHTGQAFKRNKDQHLDLNIQMKQKIIKKYEHNDVNNNNPDINNNLDSKNNEVVDNLQYLNRSKQKKKLEITIDRDNFEIKNNFVKISYKSFNLEEEENDEQLQNDEIHNKQKIENDSSEYYLNENRSQENSCKNYTCENHELFFKNQNYQQQLPNSLTQDFQLNVRQEQQDNGQKLQLNNQQINDSNVKQNSQKNNIQREKNNQNLQQDNVQDDKKLDQNFNNKKKRNYELELKEQVKRQKEELKQFQKDLNQQQNQKFQKLQQRFFQIRRQGYSQDSENTDALNMAQYNQNNRQNSQQDPQNHQKTSRIQQLLQKTQRNKKSQIEKFDRQLISPKQQDSFSNLLKLTKECQYQIFTTVKKLVG